MNYSLGPFGSGSVAYPQPPPSGATNVSYGVMGLPSNKTGGTVTDTFQVHIAKNVLTVGNREFFGPPGVTVFTFGAVPGVPTVNDSFDITNTTPHQLAF